MNQPLHDLREPVLIRAIEENMQEFWNSITFGGQTTAFGPLMEGDQSNDQRTSRLFYV